MMSLSSLCKRVVRGLLSDKISSILSVSLLSLLWSVGTWATDDRLAALDIIDGHVHIAGLGYGGSGAFINEAMRDNIRSYFFMRWMGVTLAELQRHGDQLVFSRLNEQIQQSRYIDAAVVLALDGVIDPETGQLDREETQVYVPNEYVATETAKYSRLLFGASINPHRKDAIARLQRVYRQGARLLKWIPSIMYIDPADARLIPFYRKMAALGMPLLSHTGMEKSFARARDALADPDRLRLPLSLGVTVIAAHIATTGESMGQDNFARILPMFAAYPNLYTDISSLTQINKRHYLVRALDIPGLKERMIYGSDWPLQYFPIASPWYHLGHLSIKQAWQISGIENAWDRDIKKKKCKSLSFI